MLERLFRDLSLLEHAYLPLDKGIQELLSLADDQVLVSTQSRVTASNRVILEDLDYAAVPSARVDELASWLANHALPEGLHRDRLASQLVVISDAEFQQLTQLRTEVVTRVRISAETHTVAGGALWTEEQLPAESLLYSVVRITKELRRTKDQDAPEAEEVLVKRFTTLAKDQPFFHMGGDRTLGRGLVQVRVQESPKLLRLSVHPLTESAPATMASTSQQDRIRAAQLAVDALKDQGQGEQSGLQLCIKLPSLVLNNGLGQTLAFLMSKGGVHRTLLEKLQPVLRPYGLNQPEATARWIGGSTPQQVRRATQDVMDFAGWAKRFAQAEKSAQAEKKD